jgi:hypothetical protein
MAGKPSKWSTDVTINSMEEDDEWNLMSMDRAETRRHFEHNEIQSPEDKEYESVIENQKRLRGFHEEPNTKGKTWRRVR